MNVNFEMIEEYPARVLDYAVYLERAEEFEDLEDRLV